MHQFINTKLFKISSHVLSWLTFLIIAHVIHDVESESIIRVGIAYNFVFIITFYYLNMYILIPRLLSKNYFILYIFILIISTFTVYYITKFNLDFIIKNNLHDHLFIKCIPINNINNPNLPLRSAMLVFIAFAVSTSIKVTQTLFENEENRKEIERERIKSELAYLKSQINPHFLFNTLNSIYSIANKESKKTAEAIVKLSGLMRYVLYESDNEFAPLINEIEYILDYIELQKLRIFDNVNITFQSQGEFKNHYIEPLLLIPIIENAFKHGVDSSTNTSININIKIEGKEFTMQVKNTILEQDSNKESGIGLSNLKKRLEMLYVNNHLLLIDKDDKIFRVKLVLKLKSNDNKNN